MGRLVLFDDILDILNYAMYDDKSADDVTRPANFKYGVRALISFSLRNVLMISFIFE